MKKLVIKTASITVAAIIIVALAAYFLTAAFSPKTIAEFYDKSGNYSKSVKYYAKQYKKTADFDDLKILCDKLDDKEDSERAAKYLGLFIECEEFFAFCNEQGNLGGGSLEVISAGDYYRGRYVVAVFYAQGINSAANEAKTITEKVGFSQNDAFYILITECGEFLDENAKTYVSECIESLSATIENGDKQKQYAERDLDLFDLLK